MQEQSGEKTMALRIQKRRRFYFRETYPGTLCLVGARGNAPLSDYHRESPIFLTKREARRWRNLQEQTFDLRPPSGPTNIERDPFAYNKDFNPKNPAHFNAWLKMRPMHISEEEWPLRVAKLKLMLESPSVKTKHDKSMLVLGWKSENGLLSQQ